MIGVSQNNPVSEVWHQKNTRIKGLNIPLSGEDVLSNGYVT